MYTPSLYCLTRRSHARNIDECCGTIISEHIEFIPLRLPDDFMFCPCAFYPPLSLSNFPAAYITGLIVGRTHNNTLRYFAQPSSNFYRRGGVKKFEIWPRFSTPVVFDELWLQNRGTCRKTNFTLIDDVWTSFRFRSTLQPTTPTSPILQRSNIFNFGLIFDFGALQCRNEATYLKSDCGLMSCDLNKVSK